jgi:hypothetical protein
MDFMQTHTKTGQVTKGDMAQVRLFLTIDQQTVH